MNSYEKQEYFRGSITGIISGILANIANVFVINFMNIAPTVSSFFTIVLLGNILAFSFDILSAKRVFNGVITSYFDFSTRLKWLGNGLISFTFIKFLITIIIDGTIFNTLYKYILQKLDNINFNFSYKEPLIGLLLNAVTYMTYLGMLRFYWAYNDNTSKQLDIFIIAWASILLLLYFTNNSNQSFNREIDIPDSIKNNTNLPDSYYAVR